MRARPRRFFVYLLVSATRTYVGIAIDVLRRLEQHNGVRRGGARSTRAGRPWRLAAQWGPFRSRGEALRVEHRLKRRPARERRTWQSGRLPAVAAAPLRQPRAIACLASSAAPSSPASPPQAGAVSSAVARSRSASRGE